MKKILSWLSKKFFFYIFITALAVFMVWVGKQAEKDTVAIDVIGSIENWLLDMRFFYKEEYVDKFVSEETIVVGIDDESISQIGKWPWYREVHGEFINKIQQFSPLSVHIDVIFNSKERVPEKVKDQLTNDEVSLIKVENAFHELDDAFARTLANYDNIYIDQFLSVERLLNFDEQLNEDFLFNEGILKKYSVPIGSNLTDPIYVYTEPVVREFVANAVPSVVNAVPDDDYILRLATLIYPYSSKPDELWYLSSIYLNLFLKYYDITLKQVKIYNGRIELIDAKVPELDPVMKNPLVEEIDFSEMKKRISKKALQEKYDANFYQFLIDLFRVRFRQDEFKIPEFPISVFVGENGTWSIFRGQEIYDAALTLQSKKVKVVFYRSKNVVIPTLKNQNGNPFSFMVNYASKERKFVRDSENRLKVREEFVLPTVSYNAVYRQPFFPKVPLVDKDGHLVNADDRFLLNQWFKEFVQTRIPRIQDQVFKSYGSVDDNAMFSYALQENPYEGAFIFYDLYLNQLGGSLDKEIYFNFIKNFFEQNDLPLDHALMTDFLLEENVALEYLIDAYQENYRNFYNKVVFVGPATIGMAQDVHKTPYGDMFGINTIVNAFNTVIKENFIVRSTAKNDLIFLILYTLLAAAVYLLVGNYGKYVFFIISTLGIFSLSMYLFAEYNYMLYTSSLIVVNLLVFVFITLYSLLGEERNKKFLRSSFSTYLSPEVINDMYKKKEKPSLGGEERYISAFFTDIQGFSSFSEILTANQLVELLNEYLGEMTNILLEEKGTLDKYEGDAIIAFFGAPLNLSDGDYRACFTAVKMQKKLSELRNLWASQYGEDYLGRNLKNISEKKWKSGNKWPNLVHQMRMRIGINSGKIVVGNMGSEKRQNYTMMGDDVNLAARLESAAKAYGVYTIASERTLNSECEENKIRFRVRDRFEVRLIDKIIVVGKSEPVEMYEILGLKNQILEEIQKMLKVYNEGLEFYFKMEWNKAIAKFKIAEKMEPTRHFSKTTPSTELIQKCVQYKKKPPVLSGKGKSKGKWDGVTVLTSK